MKIILASKSPRRCEILKNIGLDFDVCASDFEEKYDASMNPGDVVRYLSYNKALHVSMKQRDEAVIIGADTVVVVDNTIMGKPIDLEDSYKMLKKLSGRWHSVYSGICIMDSVTNRYICDFEKTDVLIKDLTDKEIFDYIKTDEPKDKAGSYAIQGKGSLLVERINGCYYNVVGLPVFKLSNMLKSFGIDLLSF